MCGIAGIFGCAPQAGIADEIARMTARIRHRGPDDEGYVIIPAIGGREAIECHGDETVVSRRQGQHVRDYKAPACAAIGHRRLAIIDLSDAAHQPMRTVDGTMWLAFNGEIYNYRELRDELIAAGERVGSASDTEVLLVSLRRWGVSCLSRLNGMFAFVAYDAREGRVLVARDRAGVKPMYITLLRDRPGLAVASEIKALLELRDVEACVNETLLSDFLALGRLDHSDQTFYRGINSLPPGHVLEWTPFGTRLSRFADAWPDVEAEVEKRPQPADIADHIRRSIELRLRSDVPVGFCLSGGIDSSSIVSIAARRTAEVPTFDGRLHAFTLRSSDPSTDEGRFRDAALEQFREVAVHDVYPTATEFAAGYQQLFEAQDEPFGGPSVYGQYRLFELARRTGVKVILDGQGGDELFGGYNRYIATRIRELIANAEWSEAAAILATRPVVSTTHLLAESKTVARGRNWLRRAGLRVADMAFVSEAFLSAHAERLQAECEQSRGNQSLRSAMRADFLRESLPRLLRYEDRNSMAFSLESRVPLTDDPPLLEAAQQLTSKDLIRYGWTKLAFRKAMTGIVSPSVLARRRKIGFALPERHWANVLRSSPLWHDALTVADGYIDRAWCERQRGRLAPAVVWRSIEAGLLLTAITRGRRNAL